jgi:predicted nucleic acid-binding protein
VKPRPDSGVIAWLAEIDEDRVFLSVVTLAELRRGIERLPSGARRNKLDLWLREELPLRFEGRILVVDSSIADAWGQIMWAQIMARSQAPGRTLPLLDAFLAATAQVHRLTMVTRNVSDFWVLGPSVLNPWTA